MFAKKDAVNSNDDQCRRHGSRLGVEARSTGSSGPFQFWYHHLGNHDAG